MNVVGENFTMVVATCNDGNKQACYTYHRETQRQESTIGDYTKQAEESETPAQKHNESSKQRVHKPLGRNQRIEH